MIGSTDYFLYTFKIAHVKTIDYRFFRIFSTIIKIYEYKVIFNFTTIENIKEKRKGLLKITSRCNICSVVGLNVAFYEVNWLKKCLEEEKKTNISIKLFLKHCEILRFNQNRKYR